MSLVALKIGLQKYFKPRFYLNESVLDFTWSYIRFVVWPIWARGGLVMTYHEALNELTLEKACGYPYHYKFQTKAEVIFDDPVELERETNRRLDGEDFTSVSTVTLKDELRAEEKVDAHKTRVFIYDNIQTLLPAIICFKRQDEALMNHLHEHPIAIGMQLPGPDFHRAVFSLKKRAYGADVSNRDGSYLLQVARRERDLRADALPSRYTKFVRNYFDKILSGWCTVLDLLFWVVGNKSGHLLTSFNNSFCTWSEITYAVIILKKCQTFRDIEEELILRIVGDDVILSLATLDWCHVSALLLEVGVTYEVECETPRLPHLNTFLSHKMKWRYIRNLGDVFVAAGNLDKLLASLHWVKRSSTLTLEESVVAHLLGLRICLFPWAVWFEYMEEILDKVLADVAWTPFIKNVLNARLPEKRIAQLHLRYECFFFDTDSYGDIPLYVMRCLNSLEAA